MRTPERRAASDANRRSRLLLWGRAAGAGPLSGGRGNLPRGRPAVRRRSSIAASVSRPLPRSPNPGDAPHAGPGRRAGPTAPSRVTLLEGQQIDRGRPGSPTPDPMSRTVGGEPCRERQGAANRRESAICREYTTDPSAGPRPPAGIASATSQSARSSRRPSWRAARVIPAQWAALRTVSSPCWPAIWVTVSRETSPRKRDRGCGGQAQRMFHVKHNGGRAERMDCR